MSFAATIAIPAFASLALFAATLATVLLLALAIQFLEEVILAYFVDVECKLSLRQQLYVF